MSFHVTLPSNTPSHIKNTQSDFTTFLNDNIHLKGDYEVALSEINFSSNYTFNFGKLVINHVSFEEDIIIELVLPNGISLVEFVNFLNRLFTSEMSCQTGLTL